MYELNFSGINLDQVKLFLKAVELGSFTEAGSQMFLSQSAASKKISALEQSLGMQLFVRKNRRIEPTPAARLLYERLGDYIQRFELAVQDAMTIGQHGIDGLHIGILDPLAVPNLIDTIAAFRKLYTMYMIQLVTHELADLRTKLMTGELDLIFTLDFEMLAFPAAYGRRRFNLGPMMIFMSEEHHLARRDAVGMSDLAEEKFIIHSPSLVPSYSKLLTELCAAHGFRFSVARIVDNHSSFLPALLLNEGVLIAGASFCNAVGPGIVSFPLEGTESAQVAIWKKENATPQLLRFVEMAARAADSQPL